MRRWFVGFLICLLGAVACESDHDSLAQRNSGGAAGATVSSGGASTAGGFTVIGKGGNGSAAGGSSGGRPPDEPPGESVFTFLHGIVDAERVAVCFVVGTGVAARTPGTPEPAAGLAFGERLVVREIEGADFAKDDIQPVVITGELERLDGLDCEAAIALAKAEQARAEATGSAGAANGGAGGGGAGGAGEPEAGAGSGGTSVAPPDGETAAGAAGAGGEGGGGTALPEPPVLRFGSLPNMPAGTFAMGRSLLFAADGCIGGRAFAGSRAKDACGQLYTPRASTLSAVVVPLSRQISLFALGLQAVHASVGSVPLGPLDVEAEVTRDDSPPPPVYVGSTVTLGAVVPRVPRLDIPSGDYGAEAADGRVVVFSQSGELFSEPWQAILDRAGLPSLDNGTTYALVLIGPSFALGSRGFWNQPAIAVVPTDPMSSMQQ